MVRALDCYMEHLWFEPNPRIKVGMLAHCPSTSKWVPGGNTEEQEAARKGTGYPTALCRRFSTSVLSKNGTNLYLKMMRKSTIVIIHLRSTNDLSWV